MVQKAESALFTIKGTAACFTAGACVFSVYIDGCGGAFAFLVVDAVMSFAVDPYSFTAAFSFAAVQGGRRTFPEASAAGLVGKSGIFAHNIDFSSGTELILVIDTGSGVAFQYCHCFCPPFFYTGILCP